jgi:hypothetical protein
VSIKVNDKILGVPEMWQNETLQLKNDHKCCKMITNTGYDNYYKINLAISF